MNTGEITLNEIKFNWEIKNFKSSLPKLGDTILSPPVIDGRNNWYLYIENKAERKNYLSFGLLMHQESHKNVTYTKVKTDFEITILNDFSVRSCLWRERSRARGAH